MSSLNQKIETPNPYARATIIARQSRTDAEARFYL